MTNSNASATTPQLRIEGPVAVITLCRPQQANRLEPVDLHVLRQHFEGLASQQAGVRSVVLTGTGRHFSAGFDLGAIDQAVNGDASAAFSAMVDALEVLPQTTVCAINGGVFGGATDLALACDFRVGITSTKLFMPAARFGLHYYTSGLRRYVTRLGLTASKRLFLLAEELDAQALMDIGYLTQIVPEEELMAVALGLSHRAAKMAPLACAGMKAALNDMAADRYDAVQAHRVYQACMASQDMLEGIAALREKREPLFQAR